MRPMAMFFAATRPQRTGALILANTPAHGCTASDHASSYLGQSRSAG
jgi:hypothetical protein